MTDQEIITQLRQENYFLTNELNRFKKLCPACHGEGHFSDSTEGGIEVTCDCVSNIKRAMGKK